MEDIEDAGVIDEFAESGGGRFDAPCAIEAPDCPGGNFGELDFAGIGGPKVSKISERRAL